MTYEGFADEPYLSVKGNTLTLKWYDIDYETLGLRSEHMTTVFIPLDIIVKIETIFLVIHVGDIRQLMSLSLAKI